jgi:hypothetical protein
MTANFSRSRGQGNLYKKSVINMGIQLYNNAPNNIKKVEEYKPYKRKLKSFLTEHAFYFYSLDEFFMLWRNGIEL